MTAISDIDVKGVNTNLKVRFKRNEIYTYTGTILVAVNPYKVFKIYEPVRCHALIAACTSRASHCEPCCHCSATMRVLTRPNCATRTR